MHAPKPSPRSPRFVPRTAAVAASCSADGFYEWHTEGGVKIPYFITQASDEPFAFAGLWEYWQEQGRRGVALDCDDYHDTGQ